MSNAQNAVTYLSVLLDQGLDRPLDYSSQDTSLEVGMRVLVPVQKTLRKGTIIALKSTASVSKVHPIEKILFEESLISEELFELAEWISTYYCTPLRKVLQVILPASIRKEVKPKEQLFVKRLLHPKALTSHLLKLQEKHPSQAKILSALLKAPQGLLLTDLLSQTKCSKSPVDTLVKKKLIALQTVGINRSPLEELEFFQTKPKKLSNEQQISFEKIVDSLDENRFETHLVHGVTGSGKTEIYLQAIQSARQKGKGVILLVPEIALTTQTIERLKSRFQEKLGILHHRLSDGERFDIWHAIRRGEISIVVGARSAIFCPVKNLGLLIVDEEHESSYKQMEEQPCYHARDVAIMRGKLSKSTVVLGSATPSLESYCNAQKEKYTLSTLSKRPQDATLPKVHFINMKEAFQKASGFTLFSDELLDALKNRYAKGEQALLFLNRRGYHTFQLCTHCGESIKCRHCAVSLTFHKKQSHLSCHLCGYTLSPPPTKCPYCKAAASLRFKGVGTEQVERTLHALLPDIRTLRMDADTTRHKGSHDLMFKAFRSGKADVLIGTQMIAKGLHFPSVTLVGVLNADHALHLPDFRSSEWVFQLITQVAGRAGRGTLSGEVIIQTCMQNHPILKLAAEENYTQFYEREIAVRKLFEYPPFSRLTKLTFSGKNESQTFEMALAFRKALIQALPSSCTLYPIIPSGYAKIKDHYRFQLLVKGKESRLLSYAIKSCLQNQNLTSRSIRLLVDIDPLSVFS